MYFVRYGNETLHDVRTNNTDDQRILLSLSLDCKTNECGYCDFEMSSDHPMYDELKERNSASPLQVYEDDELMFSGFIYEIGEEFDRTRTIKCKGELSYLDDSVVRPYSTLEGDYGAIVPSTLAGYFSWLIEQHNSQVDSTKQFTVGINEASSLDSNDFIYRMSVEFPTTAEEIMSKIIDYTGGYLRIRHENGKRYIDLLKEYTDTNSQLIDFGVNILDYAKTDDSLSVYSAVLPLGANMSDTDYIHSDGYYLTADKTPDYNKVYYSQPKYSRCQNGMQKFEEGVKYFELVENKSYTPTMDSVPNQWKTYYKLGEMTEITDLEYFDKGLTYYELVTSSYTDTSKRTYTYVVSSDPTSGKKEPYSSKTYYIVKSDTVKTYYDLESFRDDLTYYTRTTVATTESFRYVYTKATTATPKENETYYTFTFKSVSGESFVEFDEDETYYECVITGDEVKTNTERVKTTDKTPNPGKTYYIQNWTSISGKSEWPDNNTYYEVTTYSWYVEVTETAPIYGKAYYSMANYSSSKNVEEFLTTFDEEKTYYEFKEAYNKSNKPLTLDLYPDGSLTEDVFHSGDMIYSNSKVSEYGLRVCKVQNSDITTVEDLIYYGYAQLNMLMSPITTITIKAVDLSLINKEYKSIKVGQYVRIRSKPHNFDSYMLCDDITLDLLNPGNTTYTFGVSYDTLTGQQNSKIKALNSTINKQYEAIAAISEEAKTAAILASNVNKKLAQLGGKYLYIKYSANENGDPMTDLPDDDTMYMGIYSGDSSTPPTDPTLYTWSRTKGSDGQSVKGEDGKSAYLHIKYSNDGGTSFTGHGGEDAGDWLGSYTDDVEADSTNTSDYKWVKVKGENGSAGEKGDKGDTGDTGPSGSNGVGVSEIIEEYYLSTSKTEPIGGKWSTTPPTWSNGTYVWTRSKIIYSNDEISYTTPMCDSSWEAMDEMISENAATNRASGTSITLTDSADGSVIDFKAYGRSTEYASVGDKGWFDGELLQGYYTSTKNFNSAFTSDASYICNKNVIYCEENDIIKYTYGEVVTQLGMFFWDKDGNFVDRAYGSSTSEVIATVPTNASFLTFWVMKGGITPQTAKHICVTINGTYAIKVKSTGKNLLKNTASTTTVNGITYTVNADKSITVKGTATALSYINVGKIELSKGKSYILSGCPSGGGYQTTYRQFFGNATIDYAQDTGSGVTVSPPTDLSNVVVSMQVFEGCTVNNLTFYPMVRRIIETDSTYEPYKESVQYIPLTEPLRGIGEVKDEIVCQNGVYGITQKTKELFINGSESNISENSTYSYFLVSLTDMKAYSTVVCSHFRYNGMVYDEGCIWAGSAGLAINKFGNISTLNEFKTWLQANPITVIYELAEPVFEPFADQTPFYNIATYNPVTMISATDNPHVEVSYYKSNNEGQNLADSNTQTAVKVDKAQNTADDALNAANNSQSWIDSKGDNLYSMVTKWTDGAVSDKTTIKGGWIDTNTITADKIALGDFTNLITVNANNPASMLPSTFFGGTTPVINSSYPQFSGFKRPGTGDHIMFCNYTRFDMQVDDELYVDIQVYNDGTTAATGEVGIWGFNEDSVYVTHLKTSNYTFPVGAWTSITGTLKISLDFMKAMPVKYVLGLSCSGNIIIRAGSYIRKKNKGALIVDGSITADQIDVKTLTANSLMVGAINEQINKATTNYMEFVTGEGLSVGNKTSGSWSGKRTRMDSDSFDILDEDGTALASFGSNNIDLGNNNEDTVINMKNNSLIIRTNDTYECAPNEFSSINKPLMISSTKNYAAEITGNSSIYFNTDIYTSDYETSLYMTSLISNGTYGNYSTSNAGVLARAWDDGTRTYGFLTLSGDDQIKLCTGGNNIFTIGRDSILIDAKSISIYGSKTLTGYTFFNNDYTTIGRYRFNAGWIGFYSTATDATNNANRKGWIGYDTTNDLKLYNSSGGIELWNNRGDGIVFQNWDSYSVFMPSDNSTYLGASSGRWKQLFAVTGTISTSDRNKKKDIKPFSEDYENLFFDLKPIIYKFKDGESGRVHSGFISQDVEESLNDNNLSPTDFAGFCKDVKRIRNEETGKYEDVLDEDGNVEYDYSLRYEEFIALNTHMLQKAYDKINDQQAEIDDLKKRLAKLEKLIGETRDDGDN